MGKRDVKVHSGDLHFIVGEVDPKILRHIDGVAARNSAVASIVSISIFAVVVFSSGLYQSLENFVVGYATVLLLISAFRIFIALRFRALYSAGPARWRQLFASGILSQALLWGSFNAIVAYLGGLSYGTFLATLYTLGSSTAMAGAWMAGIRYRLLFLFLMLAPTAFAFFISLEWQLAVVGALLAFYGLYLVRFYREFHDTFWHAVARRQRHSHQEHSKLADNENQLKILSRVTRDLRSPLNSLLGMLELLHETEMDSEQKEYHLVAAQSGRLMLMQLNNVLDYSQILLGNIAFAPSDFVLREQLEHSVDAYGSIAQRQGLELSAVFDTRLPRRVRGDKQRIVQVINGLLAHSIKYADEGEVVITAHFEEDSAYDGTLEVAVSNESEGLSAQQLEKLFSQEWFDDAVEEVTSQSGLNLLVSRGLIEGMGGALFAGSIDTGSQVGFRLPLPARPDMSERMEWRRTLRHKEFVLVGSAPGGFTALENELHALDINTYVADDYSDALQDLRSAAREQRFKDLLVIDLWQNKEKALRLCDSVIEDPAIQGCRILLLGSVEQVGLEKVLSRTQNSLVQVLAKPMHRSVLREVLARYYGLQSLLIEDEVYHESTLEQERKKKFRLLLIEDNEADLAVTKSMLNKLGYEVTSVSDLEEAMALLSRKPIDLLLTELYLQSRSVLDWVKELRLTEEEMGAERLAIIALTADTTEGIQPKCLAAGIDDYIAKPLVFDQLDGLLRYWLPATYEERNIQK
ncbi:MAG TPA: response regulator [Alcanivoracaceae bacterium]|nr:response regulator [Alcanivoracaceae bacterium]